MSALQKIEEDRRCYPRVAINSSVNYKLQQDEAYKTGLLLDISQTGALIGLNQELHADTLLTLLITPEHSNEAPIEMTAEVIRICSYYDADDSEADEEYPFIYGCMILDVENI